MTSEIYDLHPRVAHALSQRKLVWTNEYRYPPYRMENGGSIDFVGIDPQDGTIHIIECKTTVQTLTYLEDQLYKYWHAFLIPEAVKEVYAFDVTGHQREWLESRKIGVFTIEMNAPKASTGTPWQSWEDFQTIFTYWHGFPMAQRIQFYVSNPYMTLAPEWQQSAYRINLSQAYMKRLDDNDLSIYHNRAPIGPIFSAQFAAPSPRSIED